MQRIPERLTHAPHQSPPYRYLLRQPGRAQQAAARLADMGYIPVFDMGGFADCCVAVFPLTRLYVYFADRTVY